MATNTMVALLQSYAVTGSPVASIVIGSGNTIPQGYTDLFLVINGQGSAVSGGNLCVRLNADTNAYTSATRILGDGSAASSARNTQGQSSGVMVGDVANGDRFMAEINFQNYSNTTTNKTILSRYSGQTFVGGYVGLWAQTAAITQITLLINGGQNFNVGTTVNLYGIKAASVGAYATGGTIYQDATYFYHAFPATGTFTPSQNLTADVFLVAGGAGGGPAYVGGGGGAGGVRLVTGQSLANATSYTCTVGSGGTGGAFYGTVGTNGINSSLIGGAISISASGGGYGSSNDGTNPKNANSGGSGGGANYTTLTPGAGNSGGYTPVEGYAGGTNSVASGAYGSGGGGGAGGVGGNGNASSGGLGGIGTNTYSSLLSATGFGVLNSSDSLRYIGGGGGGASYGAGGGVVVAGGIGGGGQGSPGQGQPGLINTGGGGGGSDRAAASAGGQGGSGLVIVRYAK